MKKLFLLACSCWSLLQVSAQTTAFDPVFGVAGAANFTVTGTNPVNAVAIYPNGKIIGTGTRNTTNNSDFMLVKCNESGIPDATFGTNGMVTYSFNNLSKEEINAMILQPDGKIIAAGRSNVNGAYSFALARFDSLGTPDATFGTAGAVTTAIGTSSRIYAAKLQADGKFVVAGLATINANTEFVLARYNSDGSLDNTFATSGIYTGAISPTSADSFMAVAIQSDGKIIAAGSTTTQSGSGQVVMRFNTDGTIDNTFGNNGVVVKYLLGFVQTFGSMLLQPDGKIIVGSTIGWSNSSINLTRYHTNGTQDLSFIGGLYGTGYQGINFRFSSPQSSAQSRLSALAIDADDKIIAAGMTYFAGGALSLIRLHATGSVDSSFGVNGRVINGSGSSQGSARITSMAIQPNGKIVAGTGDFSFTGSFIVRYLSNANGGVILPLQINDFKAQLDKGTGKLTWSVATDMDIHNIEIERSADGNSFSVIGSVPGKQEANTEEQYTFSDLHLLPGSNYYRLRIISKDGKITYSNIEVLNVSTSGNYFCIYPNPASSHSTLTMFAHIAHSENSMIRVIDMNGRIAAEQHVQLQKGDNRIAIAHNKLTIGNYLIQAYQEDGSMLDKPKMLVIR